MTARVCVNTCLTYSQASASDQLPPWPHQSGPPALPRAVGRTKGLRPRQQPQEQIADQQRILVREVGWHPLMALARRVHRDQLGHRLRGMHRTAGQDHAGTHSFNDDRVIADSCHDDSGSGTACTALP